MKHRNEENIKEAQAMRAAGATHREIAERFKISQSAVRTWIDPGYYEGRKKAAAEYFKQHPDRATEASKKWRSNLTREELDEQNLKNRARYRNDPKVRAWISANAAKYRRTHQGALAGRVRMATLSWAGRMTKVHWDLMEAVSGETQEQCQARMVHEELDHIVPISAFDLTNPEHLVRCLYKDNVRSVSARENQLKGPKHDCPDILALPWTGTRYALDVAAAFIKKSIERLEKFLAKETAHPITLG